MNAAFSRYNLESELRRPFYLYVDEFPSFSTRAFADMLAEARKYRLGVIIANQNIAQADRELFSAIIGNVGTTCAFRIGSLDAPFFATHLETISEFDLTRLPNYRAYVQLMVRGHKTQTFSANMYPPFHS